MSLLRHLEQIINLSEPLLLPSEKNTEDSSILLKLLV